MLSLAFSLDQFSSEVKDFGSQKLDKPLDIMYYI